MQRGLLADINCFSVGKTGVKGGSMAVGLHSISLYSLLCLQGSEKGAVYCVPSSAALEMLAY